MKWQTISLGLIAALFSTAALAADIPCGPGGILADFESGGVAAGFAAEQMQRGRGEHVSDPATPGNSAVRLR